AIGRAKNPAAARRHIIKRARAMDAIDSLPEGWNVQEAASLLDRHCEVCGAACADDAQRCWNCSAPLDTDVIRSPLPLPLGDRAQPALPLPLAEAAADMVGPGV